MDLWSHGEIEISLFHGLDDRLIGQLRRFDLNKAAEGIAHGICQREPVVVVIGGHCKKLLSAPEHLVVALGIKTVETVVLAAMVVDLHGPESLEILVIVIIL